MGEDGLRMSRTKRARHAVPLRKERADSSGKRHPSERQARRFSASRQGSVHRNKARGLSRWGFLEPWDGKLETIGFERMQKPDAIRGFVALKRAAAVAACLVLLYFGTGGAYLHHHKAGSEAPCHVCQSLHAPGIGPSAHGLLSTPAAIGWYSDVAVYAAPSDPFSFHRAGRAPPTA